MAIIGELDKKGRNDEGELVGLSGLLIWFCRQACVTEWGTQEERKANTWCDRCTQTHRDREKKKRPAGGVQVSPLSLKFPCQNLNLLSAKPCQLMHNRLSALFTGCEIVSMNSFWQETSCRILRVPASIYVCAYCRGSVLKTVRHFGVSSKMRRWLAMWDRLLGAIRALTGGKRWRGFLQGEPHGYSYIVCPCKKRIRVWMPASI